MRRCSRIESSNNKNYRFLTRWTCTGFGFIFIFRKMRLLMENIKPVGEPGATGSIFIFIFRKGWPESLLSRGPLTSTLFVEFKSRVELDSTVSFPSKSQNKYF